MKALMLIVCLGFSTETLAIQKFAKTPEEAQMCEKVIFGRIPAKKTPDWGHMHHYCDGVRFHDRAVRTRSDRSDFKHNISSSLDGFDYVLQHTSPSWELRPEVLVMRGRTLELAGKGFEGAQLYNEALKLNPSFSMAYAALGNFHAKSGDKNQALKIYEEGLRRSPNNRYLRSRYKVLGGVPLESK